MKQIKSIYLLIFISFLSSCATSNDDVIEQPNIILFFVDDMGWQDSSVPFWEQKTPLNERYVTPNMERLANTSLLFTQTYATPVCSPSRISLMTGSNAARHRVTNWTLYPDQIQPSERKHEALSYPMWNVNGMSMDTTRLAYQATPLPAILKQHGYQTIHVGKAHFGAISTPGEDPLNLGFNVNIAGHAGGAPKTYHAQDYFGTKAGAKKGPWDIPGLEKYDGQHINLTEALTREAIAETQRSIDDKKPFFLYMAHYGVHTPIMEDDRFYQPYLDRGIDTIEAKYASMITSMDKSLGDLIDHLEQNQLTENTIILFMSDNGGLSANSRGGEYHTHNLPLKSGKGSMYEGGIRVPMMMSWPKKISSKQRIAAPIIIEDFFPSIIEMAGIKNYETIQHVDGQSWLSIIDHPTQPHNNDRAFIWHYPNKWGSEGPGIGPASAIRKGDWKLIYFHLDQRYELYNIQQDIGEERNMISEQKVKANELISHLRAYLKNVDAQMPSDKLTGEIIPYPKNL